MPAKVKKITKGQKKGQYKVETPEGVKAKGTTKKKAEPKEGFLKALSTDGGLQEKRRPLKKVNYTEKPRAEVYLCLRLFIHALNLVWNESR